MSAFTALNWFSEPVTLCKAKKSTERWEWDRFLKGGLRRKIAVETTQNRDFQKLGGGWCGSYFCGSLYAWKKELIEWVDKDVSHYRDRKNIWQVGRKTSSKEHPPGGAHQRCGLLYLRCGPLCIDFGIFVWCFIGWLQSFSEESWGREEVTMMVALMSVCPFTWT